jgi:hypothetical protein
VGGGRGGALAVCARWGVRCCGCHGAHGEPHLDHTHNCVGDPNPTLGILLAVARWHAVPMGGGRSRPNPRHPACCCPLACSANGRGGADVALWADGVAAGFGGLSSVPHRGRPYMSIDGLHIGGPGWHICSRRFSLNPPLSFVCLRTPK